METGGGSFFFKFQCYPEGLKTENVWNVFTAPDKRQKSWNFQLRKETLCVVPVLYSSSRTGDWAPFAVWNKPITETCLFIQQLYLPVTVHDSRLGHFWGHLSHNASVDVVSGQGRTRRQKSYAYYSTDCSAALYRKLCTVSSRVQNKKKKKIEASCTWPWSVQERKKKGKKRNKRKRPAQFVKKMILLKTQRVIAEVRMQWCTHVALPESPTVHDKQATATDHALPSAWVWTLLGQDLRLLPIDSSLVYLAVSEYISLSLCVFSGKVRVSGHVNQQEHVKQQESC